MYIGIRLIRLQGILVTIVIRFIAAINTISSFFILIALLYFAVFYYILPAIIFCQILLAIFCHILLNSTSYILPSSAVNTSRFKKVENRKRISIYRYILAGLNSSNKVIIIIIRVIKRKKGVLIYRLY